MLSLIKSLVVSLILTIFIESIMSKIQKVKGINNYIVIALVNVCTNPIVVYIANITIIFKKDLYNIVVAILEILVVIVETYLFKKYLDSDISKFRISLINNACSFFIGLVLTKLIF